MPIAADTVTLWRRRAEDLDHATWDRRELSGVRCEPTRGARSGRPGPAPSDGLVAYVFADEDIRPQDRMAQGARASERPTRDSFEVTDVRRYMLGAALHHMEVEAR